MDDRHSGGRPDLPIAVAVTNAQTSTGRQRIDTLCEVCGADITSRLKGGVPEKRFCSMACWARAYRLTQGDHLRAQARARRATQRNRPAEQPCAHCGALFPTRGKQRYCKPACRQRAYVERDRPRVIALQRNAHRRKREERRREATSW